MQIPEFISAIRNRQRHTGYYNNRCIPDDLRSLRLCTLLRLARLRRSGSSSRNDVGFYHTGMYTCFPNTLEYEIMAPYMIHRPPRSLPARASIVLVIALALGPMLRAVPQLAWHGGVFFEAEDFDKRVAGNADFASLTPEKAAADGTVLYRFHHGTVLYRFRVPKRGRYRVWIRYGAPGTTTLYAALDPKISSPPSVGEINP